MERKVKIGLIFTLKIGITVFFIAVLFRYVEFGKVWTVLRTVEPFYFLMAVLAALVNVGWVSALRWKYLIHFDVEGGFKKICLLSLIGQGLNFIFPGNFIGEVVKGFNVSGKDISGRAIAASIIMDKIVILTSLTILSFVGLFLTRRLLVEAGLFVYPAAVVAVLVTVVALIYTGGMKWIVDNVRVLPESLRNKLAEFLKVFDVYSQERRSVLCSLACALVATSLTSLIFYLIARGLAVNLSFWVWFGFVPVVNVISRIPITVAGLGLRDSALMFLLNSVAMPSSLSLSISLLFFAVFVVISVIGAGAYVTLQLVKLSRNMALVQSNNNPGLK